MELDWLKIVAPIVIGVIGIPLALPGVLKAWAEYKNIHRSMLRAESDFSWALAEKLNNADLRRYAEKIGYSTIFWKGNLSLAQKKAILSGRENEKAVELYLKCTDLVVVSAHPFVIGWRVPRHSKPVNRMLYKVWRFAAYFPVAFLGFTPLVAWYINFPQKDVPLALWAVEGLTGSLSLWGGIQILLDKEKMISAERLMELVSDEQDPDSRD